MCCRRTIASWRMLHHLKSATSSNQDWPCHRPLSSRQSLCRHLPLQVIPGRQPVVQVLIAGKAVSTEHQVIGLSQVKLDCTGLECTLQFWLGHDAAFPPQTNKQLGPRCASAWKTRRIHWDSPYSCVSGHDSPLLIKKPFRSKGVSLMPHKRRPWLHVTHRASSVFALLVRFCNPSLYNPNPRPSLLLLHEHSIDELSHRYHQSHQDGGQPMAPPCAPAQNFHSVDLLLLDHWAELDTTWSPPKTLGTEGGLALQSLISSDKLEATSFLSASWNHAIIRRRFVEGSKSNSLARTEEALQVKLITGGLIQPLTTGPFPVQPSPSQPALHGVLHPRSLWNR